MVHGKNVPEAYMTDPTKKISEFYDGYGLFEIIYIETTRYKDIVFAFKSNGVMSE